MSDLAETSLANNARGKDNFTNKTAELVNGDKTEEAIKLVNNSVKTYPNNRDAYWCRKLAIADFNKTKKPAPSWKQRYTEPYRTVAQSKLTKH